MVLKKATERKRHQDHLDNEISIVPFKYKYFPQLIEILQDRNFPNIEQVSMKSLPRIGYMALLHNQPIAAGFLRRVEGGYAQMDTLCSNPYFGSKIRHEAIHKVVSSLIEEAKDLKLLGIIAFTTDESVINRAKDLGFQVVSAQLISLPLT